MARSTFSLRAIRCPACNARLPVRGHEVIVVCEYCDARVEIERRGAPPMHPPASGRHHVATPHVSGFVWAFALVPFILTGAVASFLFWGKRDTAAVEATAVASETIAVVEPTTLEPVEPPASELISVAADEPLTSEEPTEEQTGASADSEPAEDRPASPKPRPSKPKAPTGPVITVDQARQQLTPKVLACMRETKTHALLAYMGNKTVGPVSVLQSPTTRVDGLRTKLARTKLGRCMNEAGRTVNTRAFRSNYVRFELRNDAVPNPLADLPAKADRSAVKAAITAVDPQIHACARKHGEQGAREVFYFSIDGPTGKVISARGSYRSKAFRRCAEKVHRALTFPKVQQHQIKYTHHLQL